MSLAARLRESLDPQRRASKPLEVIVCVASPLTRAPADLLAQFDGLHAIQEVTPNSAVAGGATIFISYWASAEHAERNKAAFMHQLQGTRVTFEGPAGRLVVPKPPRLGLKTALLSVAALLGALEVVSNRYERVFSLPELSMRAERNAVHAIEAEELTVAATVENLLPVAAHRNIEFTAAMVDPAGNRTVLNSSDARVSSLAAGKSRTFTASARAPRPGTYKLRMEVKADAGWWVPARTFDASSSLRVWPRTPKPLLMLTSAHGNASRFVVQVDVGRPAPHGILCELTLRGVDGVALDPGDWRSLENTRLGRFLRAGSGAAAMSRLRWAWGATDGQRTVVVDFGLTGTTGTDWNDVAKRAAVECTTLKENSDVVV